MNGDSTAKRALRIAYLGPVASFSHQAAFETFPQLETKDFSPLPSFEAILSTIQDSAPSSSSSSSSIGDSTDTSYDYALLPVENSTNGGVVPVLDLLVQSGQGANKAIYPDIEIVGEHYLHVHHCLFCHQSIVDKAGSKDLKDLDIKILYSHPQVWGQCGKFLAAHLPLPDVERIHVSSTSAGATFVARSAIPDDNHKAAKKSSSSGGGGGGGGDDDRAGTPVPKSSKIGNVAAICSALAGEQNGLVKLATNIEDEPGQNTTRFFVIRNRHRTVVGDELAYPLANMSLPTLSWKSLITFTIAHKKPGSLAAALAVFSKHDFNLTSITTRPSREQSWHYVFFVECEHERVDNGDCSRVEQMLEELGTVTERSTSLGSWINRLKHKR